MTLTDRYTKVLRVIAAIVTCIALALQVTVATEQEYLYQRYQDETIASKASDLVGLIKAIGRGEAVQASHLVNAQYCFYEALMHSQSVELPDDEVRFIYLLAIESESHSGLIDGYVGEDGLYFAECE